jgi:hypothetical protein
LVGCTKENDAPIIQRRSSLRTEVRQALTKRFIGRGMLSSGEEITKCVKSSNLVEPIIKNAFR